MDNAKFTAYRLWRALGYSPAFSLRRAQKGAHPSTTPWATLNACVAVACARFNEWEQGGSNDDLPAARRVRLHWSLAWREARRFA